MSDSSNGCGRCGSGICTHTSSLHRLILWGLLVLQFFAVGYVIGEAKDSFDDGWRDDYTMNRMHCHTMMQMQGGSDGGMLNGRYDDIRNQVLVVKKIDINLLCRFCSCDSSKLEGIPTMTKHEITVVLLIGLVVNVGGYLCIQKWLRQDAKNEAATSVGR